MTHVPDPFPWPVKAMPAIQTHMRRYDHISLTAGELRAIFGALGWSDESAFCELSGANINTVQRWLSKYPTHPIPPWVRGWLALAQMPDAVDVVAACSKERLCPKELRATLIELGWPDGSRFSELSGANPSTVERWLKGGEGNDVPTWARGFLAMAALPNGRRLLNSLFEEFARPSDAEMRNRRALADRHGGAPPTRGNPRSG